MDQIRETQDRQNLKDINKQVYRDIEEFNKYEEINRQYRKEREKINDKELVNSILEKERALDAIDKKEKVNFHILPIIGKKDKRV